MPDSTEPPTRPYTIAPDSEKLKYNWSFPWHSDACDVELKYENSLGRQYFCNTHGQWVTDHPVTRVLTLTYRDGTIKVLNHKWCN